MRHIPIKRRRARISKTTRIAYVLRAPQDQTTRHLGRLLINGCAYTCALGKSGITSRKREGDGATPRASMTVLAGRYRQDRVKKPGKLGSFWQRIEQSDGWCDAEFTPNYNQPVKLPHKTSHEIMTRDDHLYDRLMVLDWNIRKRVQGRGSAIFFHQARTKEGVLQGTEGCIAISPGLFEKLAPKLERLHAIKVL